jgi:beta-phosphoglucomutase
MSKYRIRIMAQSKGGDETIVVQIALQDKRESMTLNIRAFLFDLDGVITDTAEFHFLSWKRLADEQGIPFTREDNEALRGVSRRQSLDLMLKGREIEEDVALEWMERKNGYYLEHLETITPDHILPGVRTLLDESRAAGIQIALASASRNAKPVLAKLKIEDAFDAIGDGYSVVNTKPAPDLFLWTAGRLGVNPSNAVVFEDAEAGIDAALRGAFWAVGVGTANVSRAHVRLPDLADAHAAGILEALNAAARSTRG